MSSRFNGRLIGMMTVCNEADVLEEVLRYNARIFDALLVVDNGSDDSSADIVAEVHNEFDHVILVKRLDRKTAEQVRCYLWKCFRSVACEKDWWVIIDGDEFLDPGARDAVAAAHQEGADHMFSWHANFYYKRSEYEAWLSGQESEDDRCRSIAERRRWYRMHISVIRAFRALSWIRWDRETGVPVNLAIPATTPLIFRHYQYRDWAQIVKRYSVRATREYPEWFRQANPHWFPDSPESMISSDDDPTLRYWDLCSPFVVDPQMPPIPAPSWLRAIARKARSRFYALTHNNFRLKYFAPEDVRLIRFQKPVCE